MHKDDDPEECVTINFRGKGLYTFKTKSISENVLDDEEHNQDMSREN